MESVRQPFPAIGEEELQRRTQKRRLGLVAWTSIFLLTFVGLPLIGYFSWTRVARQAFNRRTDELQAQNYPVSVEGLDRFYGAPPARRDATALWQEALAVIRSADFAADSAEIPLVDGNPPPVHDEEFASAQAFLHKHADLQAVIGRAVEMGGEARFPIQFADGYMALLPHVQDLRQVIAIPRLDAYVKAHAGDAAGAAEAIQRGLVCVRSLDREPILVSQLVRLLHLRQMVETIEDLLNRVEFSDADLAAMQQSIQRLDVRAGLRRSFIGEQALTIVAFHEVNARDLREMGVTGTGSQQISYPKAWLLTSLGTRGDDLSLFIDFMQQIIAALDKPWPEAIATADEVAMQVDEVTTGAVGEFRYALTRISLSSPDFPATIIQNAAGGEAMLKIVDALIAAERYERKHGKFPSSLHELVPDFLREVPEDPFAPQQPLQWKLDDTSLFIYSVGPDLKDDGASSVEQPRQPRAGFSPMDNQADIVLKLTR